MKSIATQIKYLFEDIKRGKFEFGFGLLQIVGAMIILCYIIVQIGIFVDTMNKLELFSENGEIYHLSINAETGMLGIAHDNDEVKSKKFDAFLEEIYSDRTEKFIVNQSMDTAVDAKQKSFDKFGEIHEGSRYIASVFVSSNFFKIFRVNGDFDLNATTKLFSEYTEGQNIPVIMGSNYKRYFNKGDTFSDDLGKTYIVEGFFDRNEFYVAPFEGSKAIYLNERIIVPYSVEPLSFVTLVSTYFRTNEVSVLEAIIDKSNKLNFLSMEYSSLDGQIQSSEEDMLNEMMTMGSVMALIFLFASIGMVAYFIRFLQSRMREFAIHMICGARESDILTRISLQFALILIVSTVAIICVFGIRWAVCLSVLIEAVYCSCIFLYLYSVIKKISLVSLLRSNAK
jgi:hypothetical protein